MILPLLDKAICEYCSGDHRVGMVCNSHPLFTPCVIPKPIRHMKDIKVSMDVLREGDFTMMVAYKVFNYDAYIQHTQVLDV